MTASTRGASRRISAKVHAARKHARELEIDEEAIEAEQRPPVGLLEAETA